MQKYKFKYIKVVNKPMRFGEVIARVDVTHLTKKAREAEWDRMDKKYDTDHYVSCLEQRNDQCETFEKHPPEKEIVESIQKKVVHIKRKEDGSLYAKEPFEGFSHYGKYISVLGDEESVHHLFTTNPDKDAVHLLVANALNKKMSQHLIHNHKVKCDSWLTASQYQTQYDALMDLLNLI